jgi:hypothetical protein
MALEDRVSEMWSWLDFLLSTVLPVAGRELLHWLYEWQVLIAGILAILAARIWGRSVVRAARYAALSATGEAADPPGARRNAVVPFASVRPKAGRSEPADRVFALREQIRLTLGKMPCTDEALSAERLSECHRIANMPMGELPKDASKAAAQSLEVLRGDLSALGALRETDTCRRAWETLVRVNTDARDFMSKPEAAPAARRA